MSIIFQKFIIPLLIPVLVGMGSAALTSMLATARLEERQSHLERKMDEHIRGAVDLNKKDSEFERRVSKLEGISEAMQRSLTEISTDVKMILKAQKFNP